LDVGGYSSRPDASDVAEDEELQRVVSTVKIILKQFPETLLSIDTFRSRIADEALKNGAAIINDISAGVLDSDMLKTVALHQVPYIMMHLRGTPKTMQQQTDYNNLAQDILHYFSKKIALAQTHHIHDIIIDPGFGFAKTRQQNYQLLNKLELFQAFKTHFLVDVSRNYMIY